MSSASGFLLASNSFAASLARSTSCLGRRFLCRRVFSFGLASSDFLGPGHFIGFSLGLWLGVSRCLLDAARLRERGLVIVKFLGRGVITFTLYLTHVCTLVRLWIVVEGCFHRA